MHKRDIKFTRLVSSEKYTLNGKRVNTERFRVEQQGKNTYEFEMHKGVLINETARASSPAELTEIFDGTLVKQFSRRKDGSTFDPAEVEAWEAELVHIAASQFSQSTSTADQIRNAQRHPISREEPPCTQICT
jgi:hypothetical protein